MPTETPDDLDAATAEFEAASDALTKAQEAYDEKRTADPVAYTIETPPWA